MYNQEFSFCEEDLHILFKLLLDHTLMIKHKLPYYSETSLALKITALALLIAYIHWPNEIWHLSNVQVLPTSVIELTANYGTLSLIHQKLLPRTVVLHI